MLAGPHLSTLFPYTTLFRSGRGGNPSLRCGEEMRPQAGVDRLKPVPPMHANDLPVVGQALSPANRIISHLLTVGALIGRVPSPAGRPQPSTVVGGNAADGREREVKRHQMHVVGDRTVHEPTAGEERTVGGQVETVLPGRLLQVERV